MREKISKFVKNTVQSAYNDNCWEYIFMSIYGNVDTCVYRNNGEVRNK